jgi:hypothetical protein
MKGKRPGGTGTEDEKTEVRKNKVKKGLGRWVDANGVGRNLDGRQEVGKSRQKIQGKDDR